jgi:hypothetical protein
MDALLFGHIGPWPLMDDLFATLPSPFSEAERQRSWSSEERNNEPLECHDL